MYSCGMMDNRTRELELCYVLLGRRIRSPDNPNVQCVSVCGQLQVDFLSMHIDNTLSLSYSYLHYAHERFLLENEKKICSPRDVSDLAVLCCRRESL